MLRKLVKAGLIGVGVYIGYALVSGNVLLHFNKPKTKEELDQENSPAYYSDDGIDGPDKAAFFDTQDILLTLHLNLIASAKQSIKFANFSIKDGVASDLFYGKLLEAADRGIEVNILFDGKGHNLFGISKGKYWAILSHPNINLAFYEEFDWLRPWTWQNRMHDKYMLIDNDYVLTGGVNLEDAFFVKDHNKAVYDRDVVIINTDPDRYDESVLKHYSDYFESMWMHSFTTIKPSHIEKRYEQSAKETHDSLLLTLKQAEETNHYGASITIDWEDHMYPTKKVSLVTNAIQRWKKDPYILNTLGKLFAEAQESIIIQSPYIVPSKEMKQYISLQNTKAKLFFVTNSLAVSTNFFAMSGQRKHLKELSRDATQIYHFQGEGYIHAKAYLIDKRLSLIGSFNFDPRSSFLSAENLVIIDSPQLSAALEESIKEIAKESVPYIEDGENFVQSTAKNVRTPWYKKIILGLFYVIFHPLEDLL